MRVCIPVAGDYGLESTVYGHFGSAPHFLIADTETGTLHPVSNRNQAHEHGRCSPMEALSGERIDALIVGGIGARALEGLLRLGIAVYRFDGFSAGEALEALGRGSLPLMTSREQCSGHGAGHGDCRH